MTHHRDIPMPPAIAALPQDPRGYPIFFTIHQEEGQPVDFRVQSMARKIHAGKNRLCNICGQPLGYWFWFFGGPMCLKSRTFGEPPMHRECIEYAIQVCPFLSRPHVDYKPDRPLPEGVTTDPYLITKKPEHMLLYLTRSYKMFSPDGHVLLFKSAPPKQIEWRDKDGTPLAVQPT